MTASPGVIATHRMFHSWGGGAFTARPDICDDCRGAYVAASRKRATPRMEAPTYGELRERAGTPLRPRGHGILEPTFREAMERHGYVAARPEPRRRDTDGA